MKTVSLGKTACLYVLVVLFLLQGCAQRPPRVKVAPTFVTPMQVADLVRYSELEWVRWGKRVVYATPGTPLCLSQADGSCVKVADGCGDEQAEALCPVVHSYWADVLNGRTRHSCGLVDVCSVSWPAGEMRRPEDTKAWSAAFVSSMLKRANFSSSEFWPSANHAAYIAASRDGYTSAFEAVPTPARPQVGDIICASRGQNRLTPRQIGLIGYDGPGMHCDIVVEVDSQTRMLHAIGGNVQQTVARTLVPLDAQGLLQFSEFSERPWILILRARRSNTTQSVNPL